MKMTKAIVLAILFLAPVACGSLAQKVSQLKLGGTKNEVRAAMGAANYSKAEGNLEIWQYATVAGFGYCDYRKIWFWKGKVTSISGYHNASIAGCSVGLRHINWEAAMANAPITDESSTEIINGRAMKESPYSKIEEKPKAETSTIADELAKLENLHNSGTLTDAEFAQAKRKLLTQE
jgi:hypothetical protein